MDNERAYLWHCFPFYRTREILWCSTVFRWIGHKFKLFDFCQLNQQSWRTWEQLNHFCSCGPSYLLIFPCVCLVAQSCLTLCNFVDYSPPDSSLHGILQARILEWVAIPFSRGSSWPRDQTCIVGGFFSVSATREAPSTSIQILNY